MTPTSAAAGLTITFTGQFNFTDPDGNLNGGTINYTYEGTTYSLPLPNELAGITSGAISFSLQAILSSNTGEMDIPIWLADNQGNHSNTILGPFTQLWTRQFGTLLEDIGSGIAIDGTDNTIVTGTTSGSLDEQLNLGLSDVFLTKYAPDTTRLWTQLIGSSNIDTGRRVTVDSNNNIYIAGDTLGSSFAGQVSDGSQAGFLSKFDAAGTTAWTRLINTNGSSDIAHAVTTDTGASVYVAGATMGNLNGEPYVASWDSFLVKYDTNGNLQWTRLLGTNSADYAYGVATDSAGNIYITGSTDGVLGTDPSPGDPLVNADVFVAKYTSSGLLQWITQLGTSCSEWSKDISIDSNGNIYIAGKIYTCAYPGNSAAGGYDAFVAKLNASGLEQWFRQFGTDKDDSANGVTVDSLGNAYVTGYLNSVYFSGDNEGHNIFLTKYDATGAQLWLTQEDAGYSWGNQGISAAPDSNNNIFITGSVHGQLDGHSNQNPGEDEVFIMKYDSTGVRR